MSQNPISPWERPAQSPVDQSLYGAGAINLNSLTTLLESTADQSEPLVVTLPDGNYPRQTKQILVPFANKDTTATFRVTGTFVGFGSLLFDKIGWSGLLEWDGAGWHLIGGNAKPEI